MGLDLDVLDLEPLLSIGLELVLDKLLFLLWPPLLVLDHRLLSLPLFLPPSILLLPTYILPLPMLGSGSKYLLRASASRSRKPGSGGSRSGSSPPGSSASSTIESKEESTEPTGSTESTDAPVLAYAFASRSGSTTGSTGSNSSYLWVVEVCFTCAVWRGEGKAIPSRML